MEHKTTCLYDRWFCDAIFFSSYCLLRTRRRSSSARRTLDLSGAAHSDRDGLGSGINGTGTGEGIGRRDLRGDGHATTRGKTDADTLVDAAGGDRTLGCPGKLHVSGGMMDVAGFGVKLTIVTGVGATQKLVQVP